MRYEMIPQSNQGGEALYDIVDTKNRNRSSYVMCSAIYDDAMTILAALNSTYSDKVCLHEVD